MAMIEITNGEVTSKVPYTAYESQYKKLGFRPVSDSDVEEKKDVTPVEEEHEEEDANVVVTNADEEDADEEDDADAAFVEDILEKPLSQWTTDELKEFVRIKDIDTSGAKKTNEVRSIIKAFLEEQDKASINS